MKKYFLLGCFIVLCLCAGMAAAQTTIHSNGIGGGSWYSSLTWDLGRIPTGADSVVIMGTDSVFFHPDPSLMDSCLSLTVLSGGKFATPNVIDSFKVINVLTLQDNAWYFKDSSYGSTLPGSARVLDHNSWVRWGRSTLGGAGNFEFGNLLVSRNAGVVAGGNLNIWGDLVLNNAAFANTLKGIDKNVSGYYTHHVHGNLLIRRGTFSCVDVGSDSTVGCTWNIDGNVTVEPVINNPAGPDSDDARIGVFSSASATGIGVINVGGNMTFNAGRLQVGASSTQGHGGMATFNLAGDLYMGPHSHTSPKNHKGPFAFNFVGHGIQHVTLVQSSFTFETLTYDTIATGSHVIFQLDGKNWNCTDTLNGYEGGAFVVNGTMEVEDSSHFKGRQSFQLNPGATLMIGNEDGIGLMPDSTHGAIQSTRWISPLDDAHYRSFSPQANYVFDGVVPQHTGKGLPTTVNKLTFINPFDVHLDTNVTVNDTLSMLDGHLYTNSSIITLGPAGVLHEEMASGVMGTIDVTRNLGASSTENFGNIGATITSSTTAPGSTFIERVTGKYQAVPGDTSILRYFDIVPTVNAGLHATLKFQYNPDAIEINGQDPSTMLLWKSFDAGSTWSYQQSVNDLGQSTLTASNIDVFGRFTGSDIAHPLGSGKGITVAGGWNMVSVPVVVSDPHTSVLFPGAAGPAFAYVAGSGYGTSDTMVNGKGYWLKFNSGKNIFLGGNTILFDSIPVKKGWNMIGSVSANVEVPSIQQSPESIVLSPYFAYTGSYVNAPTIEPCKAYWVKVSENGFLILNATAAAPKQTVGSSETFKQYNSITIADANGSRQTLYFSENAGSPDAMSAFELPPVPPATAFDARFASGRFVESIAPAVLESQLPITLQATAYPLAVAWHVNAGAQHAFTLNNQSLTGDGKFTINKPMKNLTLSSGRREIPAEFSLGKNYPNPFNPTTSVRVGLPAQSRLTLRVYNVIGQQVAEIASGVFDAGFKVFTWDGTTLSGAHASSGVYFYKLDASAMENGKTFSRVGKMMLMK